MHLVDRLEKFERQLDFQIWESLHHGGYSIDLVELRDLLSETTRYLRGEGNAEERHARRKKDHRV